MKKILLLLVCGYTIINCAAQQKELDSLLNELRKHPQEDTVRLNLLNNVAYNYSDVNADKGLETAEQAITLAKKLDSKEKLAVSILYKAMNYDANREDSLALNFYTQALNLSRQQNLKSFTATVFYNIGLFYFNRSDYSKAMENQKEAVNICDGLHDSLNMAHALVNIGVIYQFLSDYPEALAYQQKALAIYIRYGYKKGIASSYSNLGLTYLHLDNYSKALNYQQQALKIYEQTGNKQKMADVWGNMGSAYDNMKDSSNAAAYFQKSLYVSFSIGYKFGIASSTVNLGILYYWWNDYSKALPYLQKALPLYQALNDKINLALILRYIGAVYSEAPEKILPQLGINAANRYVEANDYLEKSLSIAKEIKALSSQEWALISLSTLYENKKDYKKALSLYKQADEMGDSIINDSKKQEITRLEMQYQFNKKEDSIKTVTDKNQIVAAAQIQKQRIIKNSTMAGAGFLILAGIAGFFIYKRNRDIRTKKNEAELQAHVTDTEMKALRAQMNPHFIFNSLNSIADYIDKSQIQIASDFTAKFAKLMRMVLENSEQKEIPLADDLKTLELYMQLERFRLNNKFNYEIKVDEIIDKENTLVPPLILQPFVENSIWHGIANKEGNGNIKIYIKQQDEMINCIVEDDGIGIQETDAESKEKKSLGMKITKARIDIINKLKNTNASVTIFNQQQGVRAEVKLPLELSF